MADEQVYTCVFTDICDSTSLARTYGSETWSKIKAAHDEQVISTAKSWAALWLKGTGDGFALLFANPEKAVQFALALQGKMRVKASDDVASGMKIRVGVNSGMCYMVNREGQVDYEGDAMNVAARVCSLCDPEKVLISNSTYTLVKGLRERPDMRIHFVAKGRSQLKGVPEKEDTYEVAETPKRIARVRMSFIFLLFAAAIAFVAKSVLPDESAVQPANGSPPGWISIRKLDTTLSTYLKVRQYTEKHIFLVDSGRLERRELTQPGGNSEISFPKSLNMAKYNPRQFFLVNDDFCIVANVEANELYVISFPANRDPTLATIAVKQDCQDISFEIQSPGLLLVTTDEGLPSCCKFVFRIDLQRKSVTSTPVVGVGPNAASLKKVSVDSVLAERKIGDKSLVEMYNFGTGKKYFEESQVDEFSCHDEKGFMKFKRNANENGYLLSVRTEEGDPVLETKSIIRSDYTLGDMFITEDETDKIAAISAYSIPRFRALFTIENAAQILRDQEFMEDIRSLEILPPEGTVLHIQMSERGSEGTIRRIEGKHAWIFPDAFCYTDAHDRYIVVDLASGKEMFKSAEKATYGRPLLDPNGTVVVVSDGTHVRAYRKDEKEWELVYKSSILNGKMFQTNDAFLQFIDSDNRFKVVDLRQCKEMFSSPIPADKGEYFPEKGIVLVAQKELKKIFCFINGAWQEILSGSYDRIITSKEIVFGVNLSPFGLSGVPIKAGSLATNIVGCDLVSKLNKELCNVKILETNVCFLVCHDYSQQDSQEDEPSDRKQSIWGQNAPKTHDERHVHVVDRDSLKDVWQFSLSKHSFPKVVNDGHSTNLLLRSDREADGCDVLHIFSLGKPLTHLKSIVLSDDLASASLKFSPMKKYAFVRVDEPGSPPYEFRMYETATWNRVNPVTKISSGARKKSELEIDYLSVDDYSINEDETALSLIESMGWRYDLLKTVQLPEWK